MSSYLFVDVLGYVIAFMLVWLGSGLVVSSLQQLIKVSRLPAFITSFFLLGILTSLPEIGIGTIAVTQSDPLIFVGNLLGGTIVLFLFIIPLLGFFGNGVAQPKTLSYKQLVLILSVVLAPAAVSLDHSISRIDAIILVLLYFMLGAYFLSSYSYSYNKKPSPAHRIHKPVGFLILKIILGICLLVFASQYIVRFTVYFADMVGISKFAVSLLVVSVGTNIPEISLIFRSLWGKQKDMAFADYLGSATANTPIMGVLALIHNQPIFLPQRVSYQAFAIILSLILFFFFAHSKNKLSKSESFILLIGYCCVLLSELWFFS